MSMARPADPMAVYPFFGLTDSTLPDLQADFPGYQIATEYLGLHGLCYIATRISESTGPCIVVTANADEMRLVLGTVLPGGEP